MSGHAGRCDDCVSNGRHAGPREALADRAVAEAAALRATIEGVMLTTETHAPDLRIAERLGIVTAECAFGMNLFKDIFAVGRDIFGGRAASIQNALKDARNTALDELRLEASKLGANAVIAVDLDYSEISGGGKSMLFLVATGTAVRLG
ncbi:YbjQ family protein [Tabrizicola sp. M-4]|uniref:YbjQ family protein n=1 Tax=Tabrizicola sp. M-4 TaxID=3055847 RepID=UPI003DAA0FFE